MKKLMLLMAALPMMAGAQNYKSEVWSPDNGDGTYTNPVINADYSDPDVCVGASGEDYYMTASSFQCVPGLPVLHSKDLVNWEIVGYALKELYEAPSSTAMACGHPPYVFTTVGTISTGAIPTSVSTWSRRRTPPESGRSLYA